MTMEVIKSRRGVESIRYSCFNKETGCSYMCDTNNMLVSQTVAVRSPEPKVEQ